MSKHNRDSGPEATFKDTTAYKIIRQMINHGWGSDESLEEEDLMMIQNLFSDCEGSWEGMIKGDIDQVDRLENCIKFCIDYKEISECERVAFRISHNSAG